MFRLFIDVAEPRIKTDALYLTLTGADWRPSVITAYDGDDDSTTSSDIWIEPIKKTALIAPYQTGSSWHYDHSGDSAKWGLGSFTLDTSEWFAVDWLSEGDTYLESESNLAEGTQIVCTETLDDNQGIYYSFQVYNAGNDQHIHSELVWDGGVALRFWTNGAVEVWRNGKYRGSYSISSIPLQPQSEQSGQGTSTQQRDSLVDVLIFPVNEKDLVVYSNAGGGFVHTFTEIDDDSDEPVLSGNLAINFPSGGKIRFQLNRMVYPTSGTLLSRKCVFRRPPQSDQVFSSVPYSIVNGDGNSVSDAELVVADSPSTTFTADGSQVEFRLKLTLTGNGLSSPLVYGWVGGYDPTFTSTDASEQLDITEYVSKIEVSCDSDGKGAELDFEIKNPNSLPIVSVITQHNRPVVLYWDDAEVFRGRTTPSEFTMSSVVDFDSVSIKAIDWSSALSNYRYSDSIAFDGWLLSDTLEFLLETCGFSSDYYSIPSFDDYQIAMSPDISSAKWTTEVNVGDSPGDWLSKLQEIYYGLHIAGWKPDSDGTYKYMVIDRTDSPSAEVPTLYFDTASAYLGGYDATNAHTVVVRKFKQTILEPEATQINITGRDIRTEGAILVQYIDEDLEDPELPPSYRPDGWLGEPRKYGIIEPAITTIDVAEYAALLLADRLTKPRYMAEFSSDFLYDSTTDQPLWRGDYVRLDGYGVYRINSVNINIEKDYDPSDDNGFYNMYDCRYTCEYCEDLV